MRPVEVKIIAKHEVTVLPFRSVRTACKFVEESVDEPHIIRSRVSVNNQITARWLLVAADEKKTYLIRLKPQK